VRDNSIGMTKVELSQALHIGVPPKNDTQRSKYGLGLKTAACWFGDTWSVRTKKLGEKHAVKIDVNVPKIVKEKQQVLPTQIFDEEESVHYTEVTIKNLHRQFHGNTLKKVKEFLTSMYRFDFNDFGLILKWQGTALSWEGFEERFYITQDGKPYKKPLEFTIGSPAKKITGWVGVLGKGSRKDAGFSIIQNRRVITGWPNAFKPISLYGDQDLGTNDLVNQRLIGELFVDGFAVSHTKDSILWEDNEEEELEEKLMELCADARTLAQNIRVKKHNESESLEAKKNEALSIFESELKSAELKDKLFNEVIPADVAITKSYQRLVETARKADDPVIELSVGDQEKIHVKIYFRSASEFEPYVLIETSIENNTLLVIINSLHPYWVELKSAEGYLGFIRHCVYDGLAEWKASRKTSQINHDTVKYIKDLLLRLPMEILNNKVGGYMNNEDAS